MRIDFFAFPAFFLWGFLNNFVLTWCFGSLHASKKMKDISARIASDKHNQSLMNLSFSDMAIKGPLLEELIFRGLLQPTLERATGVPCGILLTSLFFGSVHVIGAVKESSSWYRRAYVIKDFSATLQACSACIIGIFLGVFRHKFGLLASIAAHSGSNSLSYVLYVNAKNDRN